MSDATDNNHAHKGDPCIFCGLPHDDVGVGNCHGAIVPLGRIPCPWFDATVEPWGGPNSCKIPDDVEIPDCDGLTCTIPKEATEVRAEKAVKVPSKEACECAASNLEIWAGSDPGNPIYPEDKRREMMHYAAVAAYLRSLHEECEVCGTCKHYHNLWWTMGDVWCEEGRRVPLPDDIDNAPACDAWTPREGRGCER